MTLPAPPAPSPEQPDWYFENGLLVYTAAFHLKRGVCCGSGCRHCPYEPRHLEGNTEVHSCADPAAPKRVWVHWVVYNLPATSTGLAEGVGGTDLPAGAFDGLNDWKKLGYGGPCPPVGKHRYLFRLYALDRVLEHLAQPTKKALEKAMQGHVLAEAELVGVYKKHR